MIGWIILAVVVLGAILVIANFNNLISLRIRVKNAWSQIDIQLKRRYDLIPNLVETAKGYMAHERGTLENVVKARQQAIDAKGLADKAKAENMLTSTLRSLFAVAENYPDLKANQTMMKLMEELSNTENKISSSRQFYNDETQMYNTAISVFPGNVFAGVFNFKAEQFFEMEDKLERKTPQVKF